jgi:serine/threonine-protein kinase
MSSDLPIIGRTLASRFHITGLLGEGGMATVYRGTQEAEPTELAIKIMNADLAMDEKFVKRFRREAKSAAKLDHPCSVQILDYGVEDGLPYIAMELLKGAELAQILHHEQRLPEVRAARIMADVLSVLDAAHEQGIVHRDLKPENIMVARSTDDSGLDRVKVLDFGIAKILEPDRRSSKVDLNDPDDPPPSSFGRSKLTMMGTIVGTPEYMSPEQSRGGEIDGRSDLYACGVLLYHLVTGKVPFLAELPFETAMLHVTATPEPPSAITPAIHPGLEALILKAMEKSPDARPATAKEMETALRALIPELATERHALRPMPEPKVSKLDATMASVEITAPPRALATTLDDEATARSHEVTEPRGIRVGVSATIVGDDFLATPPAPPVQAAPLAPKAPLSSVASLLIGAGLAALVLLIIALVALH